MDDTFVIQKEIHKQDFLQHINSVDPAIQFTVENNKEDDAIPFLDTIVKQEADGNPSLCTENLNIPTHRAQTVCSNPELLCTEKAHLRKALTQCKYPKWALDKVVKRLYKPSSELSDEANNQGTVGAQPTTNEVKNQGSHCYTLYTRSLWKYQKYLWKVWHTDPLQR